SSGRCWGRERHFIGARSACIEYWPQVRDQIGGGVYFLRTIKEQVLPGVLGGSMGVAGKTKLLRSHLTIPPFDGNVPGDQHALLVWADFGDVVQKVLDGRGVGRIAIEFVLRKERVPQQIEIG